MVPASRSLGVWWVFFGGRSGREASPFSLIRRCRHLFLLLFLCCFFWACLCCFRPSTYHWMYRKWLLCNTKRGESLFREKERIWPGQHGAGDGCCRRSIHPSGPLPAYPSIYPALTPYPPVDLAHQSSPAWTAGPARQRPVPASSCPQSAVNPVHAVAPRGASISSSSIPPSLPIPPPPPPPPPPPSSSAAAAPASASHLLVSSRAASLLV